MRLCYQNKQKQRNRLMALRINSQPTGRQQQRCDRRSYALRVQINKQVRIRKRKVRCENSVSRSHRKNWKIYKQLTKRNRRRFCLLRKRLMLMTKKLLNSSSKLQTMKRSQLVALRTLVQKLPESRPNFRIQSLSSPKTETSLLSSQSNLKHNQLHETVWKKVSVK